MRKDSILALKETISPDGQYDKSLNNLIFNASLLVNEGLGYAIGFDKIMNTTGNSNFCYRSLAPELEDEINFI